MTSFRKTKYPFPWAAMTAALLLVAGCSVIDPELMPGRGDRTDRSGERLVPRIFKAETADTRTSLDGTRVVFSSGEAISIYDGSGNRRYTANESGHSVSFSGSVSSSATEFFALYPYSSSAVFSKSGSTVIATTTLPSSQEATPGSFAPDANIAAAKASSAGTFSMVNVMSVAKLTLASGNLAGHKVASIKLTSSYPLAGDVKVTYGPACAAAAGSSTVKAVTLARSDASAFQDGDYYIVLLPNSGGSITLEFTDTEGNIAVKTASLASAFEAGVIKDLGSVKGLTWTKDPNVPDGLLEMPSYSISSIRSTTTSGLSDLYTLKHYGTLDGKTVRTYSALYDPEMFACYWVAYPLCTGYFGSTNSKTWKYNPDVPKSKQTDLTSGSYGVSFSSENYTNNLYSRGHQIPAADRDGEMMGQTYYVTNSTPQIQNGFNGEIWNNLENAVRGLTSSADTVYVVTGAAFRKKGGSETVTTIVNKQDSKEIPVPNYYWKALLKVTWSGNKVTAATAIGFWMPHADLKGAKYTSYAVSIETLESYTGLDLFPNLPDSLESAAQKNDSWTAFQNF